MQMQRWLLLMAFAITNAEVKLQQDLRAALKAKGLGEDTINEMVGKLANEEDRLDMEAMLEVLPSPAPFLLPC